MAIRTTLFTLIVTLLTAIPLSAQTCSCAGAPLLSSQTSGTSSAGNLLFGITYDYHDISSIYTGNSRLDDETVTRTTQSVLLEANYGITDRLSISSTFSFVSKNRTTGLHTSSGGTPVTTNGIGDGVFLLRYIIHPQSIWSPYHIAVGAGTKVPFGTTSLTRNGLAMNADMQPGTGAWDGVLWSYVSTGFSAGSTHSLFISNSYRHTGSNERFSSTDNYRFGNELIVNLGFFDQLVDNLSYMLTLRFRSTSSDQLNQNIMPNTGGKWLNIVPDLNYSFSENISVRLSGQIPIYQYLNGTQPTTSFALSSSLFISFNNRDGNFNYGRPQ